MHKKLPQNHSLTLKQLRLSPICNLETAVSETQSVSKDNVVLFWEIVTEMPYELSCCEGFCKFTNSFCTIQLINIPMANK